MMGFLIGFLFVFYVSFGISTHINIYIECVSQCVLKYSDDIESPFETLAISHERSLTGESNLLKYVLHNPSINGIIRIEIVPAISICGIITTIIIDDDIYTTKDFNYFNNIPISTYDLFTCILPPPYYCNIYPVNYNYISTRSKWLQCATTQNTIIDFDLFNRIDIDDIETTLFPTNQPSIYPSNIPTINPTLNPTFKPTNNPTIIPTIFPTKLPTQKPSEYPSINPSIFPSNNPSINPTKYVLISNYSIESEILGVLRNNDNNKTLYMIFGLIGTIIILVIVILILVLLFLRKTHKMSTHTPKEAPIGSDTEKQKLNEDQFNDPNIKRRSLSRSHSEGQIKNNDNNNNIKKNNNNNSDNNSNNNDNNISHLNDDNFFPITKGEDTGTKRFVMKTPEPPLPPILLCDNNDEFKSKEPTPIPPPPPIIINDDEGEIQ